MKQLHLHGGNAYLILRRTIISKFEKGKEGINMEYLKAYRDWVGANHVLRDQSHFLFCETIQDIELEK